MGMKIEIFLVVSWFLVLGTFLVSALITHIGNTVRSVVDFYFKRKLDNINELAGTTAESRAGRKLM